MTTFADSISESISLADQTPSGANYGLTIAESASLADAQDFPRIVGIINFVLRGGYLYEDIGHGSFNSAKAIGKIAINLDRGHP